MIRAGRVRLDGAVRRDPEAPVHLAHDRVTVDGSSIEAREKIYLMMNKPRGLVTTASDEKGRETVYSVLNASGPPEKHSSEGVSPWVAPVGRLDKASEGLLLLTNDSEWGARLAAPETHLEKTYHVQIAKVADEELIAALVAGVRGETKAIEILCARQVRLLRSGQKNSWLEIILDEGKNRQIRRMLDVLGVEVLRLVRVAIGPLALGKLAKGEYRPLTPDEKKMLDYAMQSRPA